MGYTMSQAKTFHYANTFKPLSPCLSKKGGGYSLFEMYHGLKNKKIITKKGGRRISKNKNRSISKRRLSNKHNGGNRFPKNPPYMLSTAPHKPGERNLVAPTDMVLYERSFQGPFPSRSGVNFKLERPFSKNNLLVEPSPLLGGKKKKKVVKRSVKTGKKVVKRSVKTGKKVVKKSINFGRKVLKKSLKTGRKVVKRSLKTGRKVVKRS